MRSYKRTRTLAWDRKRSSRLLARNSVSWCSPNSQATCTTNYVSGSVLHTASAQTGHAPVLGTSSVNKMPNKNFTSTSQLTAIVRMEASRYRVG